MTGYVDIANALTTILQGISEIKKVFDYEPKELAEYPAATVTALSHKDAFGSTRSNVRSFVFMLRFYYRTDVAADGESILRKTLDLVIAAIEADTTLGGLVDIAEPSDAKWLYQQRELPVRLVELTVTANVKETR